MYSVFLVWTQKFISKLSNHCLTERVHCCHCSPCIETIVNSVTSINNHNIIKVTTFQSILYFLRHFDTYRSVSPTSFVDETLFHTPSKFIFILNLERSSLYSSIQKDHPPLYSAVTWVWYILNFQTLNSPCGISHSSSKAD